MFWCFLKKPSIEKTNRTYLNARGLFRFVPLLRTATNFTNLIIGTHTKKNQFFISLFHFAEERSNRTNYSSISNVKPLKMAEGGLSKNRSQESIDERSLDHHDSAIQVPYPHRHLSFLFFSLIGFVVQFNLYANEPITRCFLTFTLTFLFSVSLFVQTLLLLLMLVLCV